MKLGFLTACFPNLELEDLVRWGSKEDGIKRYTGSDFSVGIELAINFLE